ncbi:flavin-containing monooxygenase [Nocardia stercoris]|uniref:FAD-containing monooxygenase EthA n=1 Tax=Nocardia stercoris TaxID=2483361 RepID=A0A3M2L6X7_9NOCA|nr:NAD(P)/FAD-dependent oxidoreductase [Nocardia stercoris]RMI30288.1 NAD(P)/FAD-dependent oxidoreductase [Nocardia stercoris]
MTRHVDVLIIGAGLSGIGTACHLIRENTGRSFLILERRENIGGTWDLFKYPGIRSDSDMYTFGFEFKPWTGTKVLADGASIRNYVQETAEEYGVDKQIRFGRKMVKASFSTADNIWTVETVDEKTGETEIYTADFLSGCTGYYNYDAGHRPTWPGEENFRGQIVHPQAWPEDLDYQGKKVVVIGSGATAITLVPTLAARGAGHVTMLQRSPTYIATLPSDDPVAMGLKLAKVPAAMAYKVGRVRNIALQRASFQLSRNNPAAARRLLQNQVRVQVGPNVDMKHFTPKYDPWDQRLCVVPNGDLFRALKKGTASIVTDTIAEFTETGLRLDSGQELEADIIVTATGLQVQMLGGAAVELDGEPVHTRDLLMYKGVMLSDIPNAMMVVGYTNASWTLKADLAASYFCRVLNYMRDNGFNRVVATPQPGDRSEASLLGADLSSGYIARGDAVMPRQGTGGPWKVVSNFYRDRAYLRKEGLEDGIVKFSKVKPALRVVSNEESRSA